MLLDTLVNTLHTFPLPQLTYPARHKHSTITRTQVKKILPLLRNDVDKTAMMGEFSEWNDMTKQEQLNHTATVCGDDFLEISLAQNGCTIIVSIYRMDDDCIYLRLDPDCSIVIREVSI